MGRLIDLTGQHIPNSRLTVIQRVENDRQGLAQWLCKCDCGNTTTVRGRDLRRGNTRSCGCLHSQQISRLHKTHGLTNTRIYHTWSSMLSRCNNPNNKSYPNYGGRGISVCDKWQKFEPFYEWAIANGYTDDLTIDRIDNDKGYSPDNCRWVTRTIQSQNTRKNRYLEYNGKKQTISEWSREVGISPHTLRIRFKLGWSVEKALTTPVKKQKS